MVAEKTEVTEEDINNCIRCHKDKGFKGLRNRLYKFCTDCARVMADEEYLDEGSEQIIRENADRPKQVRIDSNEQEAELDKILEEY